MDTLSSVTLALAISTVLLAGAAFWSIFQTRRMRSTELKNRMLDEIIQWAIDVARCGLDREASARLLGVTYTIEVFRAEEVSELLLSFKAMSVRSEHAKTNAQVFADSCLQKSVKELTSGLETLSCRLTELRDASSDISAERQAVADGKSALDASAAKVIKQATRIKSRDAGVKGTKASSPNLEPAVGTIPSEEQLDGDRPLTQMASDLKAVKRAVRSADVKWGIGLAIATMAIAYGWLHDATPSNDPSARVIGILGILLLVWTVCWTGYSWLFASLWRKWRARGRK